MKRILIRIFASATFAIVPISAIAQTYGNGNPSMDSGKSIQTGAIEIQTSLGYTYEGTIS